MYAHSNPVPLRSHKKSTGGCRACKERKVKCDEVHPVCGKCAIHFANIKSCEWTVAKPRRSGSRRARTPAEGSGSNVIDPNLLGAQYMQERSLSRSPGPSESGTEYFRPSSPLMLSPNRLEIRDSMNKPCKVNCPCHISEHTTLLLDAILGVCRICGNKPSPLIPVTSCNPALPPALLALGKINPFGILPTESTPKVQELILHFTNNIASTPTSIHPQGFTDPHWLTMAIAHQALFHVTLYVCSMHLDALNGKQETNETLWYKTETMRLLTSALEQEGEEGTIKDETIASVILLAHVLAVTGSQSEAVSHLKGLEQMVNMRGGIQHVAMNSMLVQMLYMINHLTAVLYENPAINPQLRRVPILPSTPHPHPRYALLSAESSNAPSSSQPLRLVVDHVTSNTLDDDNLFTTTPVHDLPAFAVKIGLHKTMVQLLDHISFLHAVVDVFTTKYCPQFRRRFEEDYM